MTRFLKDNNGATAIEYAFIASLIFLAIVASVVALGGSVGNQWNNTAEQVEQAM